MSADHSADTNFSGNSVDPDKILHYAPSDPCAFQDFFQGGGGQARLPENSLDHVFFYSTTYFTVYRGGPMV